MLLPRPVTCSPDALEFPITALIQAEMDRGKMGDTGHGRLLPYSGSARSVLVTHANATGAAPSMLTSTSLALV
jgi:hypothetical protein